MPMERGEAVVLMAPEVPQNGQRHHVILLGFIALMMMVGFLAWRFQNPQQGYDGVDEKVDIDVANSREVIYSELDGQSVMMVLEFDRNMAGIYTEDKDCLLIGGLDDRIPTPVVLQELLEKGDRPVDTDGLVEFEVDLEFPVTDHTLLPEQLRELCRTKQVFWLKPATTSPDSQQKKNVDIKFSIGSISIGIHVDW